MNWDPLILSFKLAALTTILLMVISLPIAYWLAYGRFKSKAVVEALISMPLVLPPSVLGFYLLVAFSPSNQFGALLNKWFDIQLVFTFEGLVLASVIYSLPFVVHPMQAGFAALPTSIRDASYVLGKSRWTTLVRILIPNIKPAMLTAATLAFAHTIGEFGVVLMIGGSIPGKTKVASIAVYEEVEALNYSVANTYSLVLFAITFAILLFVYLSNRGMLKRYWT